MELTNHNVVQVAMACSVHNGDSRKGCNTVRCIMLTFHWIPSCLKSHRDDIVCLLRQLPDSFRKKPDGSGGASFTDACLNNKGQKWGDAVDAETLIGLGMGIDVVQLLPATKGHWRFLKDSMPYVIVSV